jgi:hypothetical protein
LEITGRDPPVEPTQSLGEGGEAVAVGVEEASRMEETIKCPTKKRAIQPRGFKSLPKGFKLPQEPAQPALPATPPPPLSAPPPQSPSEKRAEWHHRNDRANSDAAAEALAILNRINSPAASRPTKAGSASSGDVNSGEGAGVGCSDASAVILDEGALELVSAGVGIYRLVCNLCTRM